MNTKQLEELESWLDARIILFKDAARSAHPTEIVAHQSALKVLDETHRRILELLPGKPKLPEPLPLPPPPPPAPVPAAPKKKKAKVSFYR